MSVIRWARPQLRKDGYGLYVVVLRLTKAVTVSHDFSTEIRNGLMVETGSWQTTIPVSWFGMSIRICTLEMPWDDETLKREQPWAWSWGYFSSRDRNWAGFVVLTNNLSRWTDRLYFSPCKDPSGKSEAYSRWYQSLKEMAFCHMGQAIGHENFV